MDGGVMVFSPIAFGNGSIVFSNPRLLQHIDKMNQQSYNALFVKILQCYQANLTALLCLAQSIGKAALREDIVMIGITFSKYGCVIPKQFQFIRSSRCDTCRSQ